MDSSEDEAFGGFIEEVEAAGDSEDEAVSMEEAGSDADNAMDVGVEGDSEEEEEEEEEDESWGSAEEDESGEEDDEEEYDEDDDEDVYDDVDDEELLERISGDPSKATVRFLSFDRSNESDAESSGDESASDDDQSDEEPDYKLNNHMLTRKALDLERSYTRGFESVPWIETLTVAVPHVHEGSVDPQDDLQREMAFLQQALAGAELAKSRFEEHDIPYIRPDDYFAEMIKSDRHMAKVRKDLLDQKTRIEFVEKRKREREMRKFGKQIQAEKLQQQAKDKREELDRVQKWRKQRNASNRQDDDEFQIELQSAEDVLKEAKAQRIASQKTDQPKKKSKKRLAKEAKYGYGGKRKYQNANTAESFADDSSFNVKKMKKVDKDLRPLVGLGKRMGGNKKSGGKFGKHQKTRFKKR